METPSKTYNTRRKRKAEESTPKSRVDWKRTKKNSISCILDSDESEEEELEEDEEEEDEESDDDGCSDESEDQAKETALADEEDGDEGRIRKSRFKNKSAMIESESSSDSDGPGERVHVRRRSAIKEDDSAEEEDEETKARNKKQKRLEKLNQLAKKERTRKRTTSHKTPEDSSQEDYKPLTPETLSKNQDSDDMSDFIVPDEAGDNSSRAEDPEPSYKDLFRKHHISTSDSHDLSTHLQKVIKAFLINITDKNFLTSLYDGERTKRYAKDMLKSLNDLDGRIIGPRLDKLTTSCRWTKRYKERVNSYPEFRMKRVPADQTTCEACDLFRYCSYLVTLSGQAYDSETLENDDFLEDDKQYLVVGTTCGSRTEAYHQLRHYKYHLYQRCIPFIEETKEDSANEIVESALAKMQQKDFLTKEIKFLEGYLDEADYFQEEKMD